MGNTQSEFEHEFYKRYSYIQHLDDPIFGLIKIYRKTTVKYDYIMIMEIPLDSFNQPHLDSLQERLRRLKNYQNETTLRVYHYRILPHKQVQCRQNHIVIFAQYMNRTLADYLCALRSSPNFVLTIDEVIYVLKHVAKGCLSLQKMSITQFGLNSNKIFLSPDGEVLVCPLLYILESFNACESEEEVLPLRQEYRKYSVTQFNLLPEEREHFGCRNQFRQLFLQMTAHMSPNLLPQTGFIRQIIETSSSLEGLYSDLPETETETVQIEQMHRYDNMNGEFYATQQ